MDIKDIRVGDLIEFQYFDDEQMKLVLAQAHVIEVKPESGGWLELDDESDVAIETVRRIVVSADADPDCECEGNGPAVNAMGCPVHGGWS